MKRKPPPKSPLSSASGLPVLYGYHAVREALRSPKRRFHRLIATKAASDHLRSEIEARGLKPEIITADELSAWLGTEAVHQGLAAIVEPLPQVGLEDLPANGLVVVLDQVTDPRNVGAILRTAAAFQVDALIV